MNPEHQATPKSKAETLNPCCSDPVVMSRLHSGPAHLLACHWAIVAGIIWEFPKIRGTFLGVPMTRVFVYWDLYWGPPIYGNYHISSKSKAPNAQAISNTELIVVRLGS